MILRFWAVASDIGKTERILLKIRRSEYNRMRKRIIRLDKQNVKKKKIKNYPILNRYFKFSRKRIKASYIIYAVMKELKIEEIAPLNLERFLKRSNK